MAEAKAISFKGKVLEKNKTASETVGPTSTGLKGQNAQTHRTSGLGGPQTRFSVSGWAGEMPVERHPCAFPGDFPPLLPGEY